MDSTTPPVRPDVFWGTVTLAGFALATAAVFWALQATGLPTREEFWANRLRRRLRLTAFPLWLFSLTVLLWAGIVLTLVAGLYLFLVDVIFETVPLRDDKAGQWEFRFKLGQLAALTTVLGAAIALPITLNRLQIAQDSLFNDKITEAAAGLYAQRQVTQEDAANDRKLFNGWEDDITRRNAAIDRLEGLVRENPSEAGRVSRLLSVYVRELSREFPAVPVPNTDDPKEIRTWARALEPVRSDMQNAVQVLGRLADIPGVTLEDIAIDLRGANLQGFDLSGDEGAQLRFPNQARFERAQMQGATLRWVQMQGADLGEAQMQGANLVGAQLQGANLVGAQLQGVNLRGAQMQEAYLNSAQIQGADLTWAQMQSANLNGAQMQGADLRGAQMDAATNLSAATLRGAALRSVDYTEVRQIMEHVADVFGDASVKLPGGVTPGHPDWPAHWSEEVLILNLRETLEDDFLTAWRAWQASIGFDPDDPATW